MSFEGREKQVWPRVMTARRASPPGPGSQVRGDFNERAALDALQWSGCLDALPWGTLRPGKLEVREPSWVVTGDDGGAIAGFEVVELAFALVQAAKAKLSASQLETESEPAANRGPVAQARARLAHLHESLAGITDEELAAAIAEHLDPVRARYGALPHGVHVVVHEPAWLRDPGTGNRTEAVRLAAARGLGGFAAIWHVDELDATTRIA